MRVAARAARGTAVISVCLAACNGERYLGEQLSSILQSPQVSEVLVSDDGSTDGTAQVVRGIGDARVRWLEGPRRGPVRNFESLLGQARGELIFLCDQDDVWLPRKVPVMSEALARADLVVSDCRVVDQALQPLHPSFFALKNSSPGLVKNLLSNTYLGCCMALRRSLLRQALPFPPDAPMHDWWLGLVAQMCGRVEFIDEPLMLYRRHGANASSASERSRAGIAQKMRWRASLVMALAARRRQGVCDASEH
jgi:glycosyltransferase involved in cell wall biosynthesis